MTSSSLFSTMIVSFGTLMVLINMAAADPQLITPYQLPAYSSYFHQLPPASFYQPTFSPYDQAQLGTYFKPSYLSYFPETDHGLEESLSGFEGQENPYAYKLVHACPEPYIVYPCSCTVSAPLYIGAVKFGTINCPAGLTAAETKNALSSIPAGFNIQKVTLNLRRGTNTANAVGSRFPLNYPQATITIANLNDGNTCVDSSLLAPCTCQSGIITCPSNIAAGSIVPGTAIDQIQAIFNRIPANTNLGDVVLNLPAGDVAIPANMLGSNSANTIQIISDAGTNNSKLRIDAAAFSSSASTATQFWIVNFDVVNVDYTFLTGFNVLSTIQINKCANPPTTANQPTNLPANLPKLTTISVDGTNIKV